MKKLLLIFSLALVCGACQKADSLSGNPDMAAQNAANKVPYTGLTYATNGGGEIILYPKTPYIGEAFTLSPIPAAYYEYDHWTKDGYIANEPESTIINTPMDNTRQDYLVVFVPLSPRPDVATVTFLNRVGPQDFLNNTQISYVGPDGKPHTENYSKIAAMRQRFAVKKGTQMEIRVHIISKTSELFYGCYRDTKGHVWDFGQTEPEVGNSFFIDVEEDVRAIMYADPSYADGWENWLEEM